MRTYDEQYRQEVFNLIPEANWVAVDNNGNCFWYKSNLTPTLCNGAWSGVGHYIGKVIPTCDWKDSLFERKWVPKDGDTVWVADIYDKDLSYSLQFCYNYDSAKRWLKHNLIFKTKEEAIARSKQLLEIKENDMNNEWQEHGNKK